MAIFFIFCTAAVSSHTEYVTGGYDKRLEYTPIVNRSYWPGLNQVLNTFGTSVLDGLVAKASALNESNYTAESYAALTEAISNVQKASAEVTASDSAANATNTAKLNAPKGWTKLSDTATVKRLSAPDQVGAYEELSAPITTAYANLESALTGLVATKPISSNPTTNPDPNTNPKTGDNSSATVPVALFVAATLLGSGSILLRKRKAVK